MFLIYWPHSLPYKANQANAAAHFRWFVNLIFEILYLFYILGYTPS